MKIILRWALLGFLYLVILPNYIVAQNNFYGENLIIDGNFSSNTLDAWETFQIGDEGGAATANFDASTGEASITGISGTDGTSWHIQFNQILSDNQIASIVEGGIYELSFDARTDSTSKELNVFFGHNGGGWENYASPVVLSDVNETFTQSFSVNTKWGNDDFGMKIGFEGGKTDDSFYIDNVVFRRVEDNIIINGDFSADTAWAFENNGVPGDIVIENGELVFSNIGGETEIYQLQANQTFSEEQLNKIFEGPYEVSFDAKTSTGSKSINVYLGEVGGGWFSFLPVDEDGEVEISTEMKNYAFETYIDQTFPQMRIGFEVNTPGADLTVDNVIFKRIEDTPPNAPQFNLSSVDGFVTLTIADQGAKSYDIYFSEVNFTDTNEAKFIGTVDPENGLTFQHSTLAPHSSLGYSFLAYYGVVAKTEVGTKSELTVSAIETDMVIRENYIAELDEDAINMIMNAVSSESFPEGGSLVSLFPADYTPFEINVNSIQVEGGSPADSDSDISGKFWVGFENVTGNKNLVYYAEIQDDFIVPTPNADNGGGWNYDSWEAGIGAYSPQSIINGSNHQDFQAGSEPDYQLRAGFMDAASPYIHVWDGGSGNLNQLGANSATIGDDSEPGMYRLLTVVATNEFSAVNNGSSEFDFPNSEGVSTVPFIIALNDNDSESREQQYIWGNTATSQWWNTPSEWEVVALVGSNANKNDTFPQPPYAVGDTINYNGNFTLSNLGSIEQNVEGWFFDNVNGQSTYEIVDESVDGDNRAAKANIFYDNSGDIWRAQMVNEPIYPGAGDLIKASFYLKASIDGMKAEAFFGLPEAGGYADVAINSFELSTNWTYYEIEYMVSEFDAEVGLRFGVKMNYPENDQQTILLDNVQLIKQEVIPTEINFSVNTAVQQDLLNFDPNVQSVGVVGSFNGWDVDNPNILEAVNDSIFSGTLELFNVAINDTIRYKFIIKDEVTGIFEWESPDPSNLLTEGEFSDRIAVIDDLELTTVQTDYFHDIDRADQNFKNYEITSILDARNSLNNSHLAIKGIVTRATSNFVYIQDETAGTMVFSRPAFSDVNSISFNQAVQNGEIGIGDELQIAGITWDYFGLHELLRIHAWEVVSTNNDLPEPQTVEINEYSNNGEEYESELVAVEYVQILDRVDSLFGGYIYEITNEDSSQIGWLSVQGSNNSEWANQPAPQGYFNLVGPVKEFFIPSLNTNIYAVSVHNENDIEELSSVEFEINSFAALVNTSSESSIEILSLGGNTIQGLEFTIQYDPTDVSISLGDQNGTLVEGLEVLSNDIGGELLVAFATNGLDNDITDTGTLMNLSIDYLSSGETEILITNY
jgi:hypothetical protein